MKISATELDQAKADFERDGYAVIRNVVPKERLSAFRTRLMEEFEVSKRSGALFSGGGTLSGHLNCFPGVESRFAYEALLESGVVDLIKAVYSQPAALRMGLNLNLPNSVAQHYHMDGVFAEDFMIANVAVVDTDLVNGAIDVLPGTHKRFYKFWQYAIGREYRGTTRLPLSQCSPSPSAKNARPPVIPSPPTKAESNSSPTGTRRTSSANSANAPSSP